MKFCLPMVCFLLVLREIQLTPISHEQAVKITDQIEEILESPAADEVIRGIVQIMKDTHATNGTDFWVRQLAFRMKNIQKKLDQYEGDRRLEVTSGKLTTTTEPSKEDSNREQLTSIVKKKSVWRKPTKDFGQMRAIQRKKETYERLMITEKQA